MTPSKGKKGRAAPSVPRNIFTNAYKAGCNADLDCHCCCCSRAPLLLRGGLFSMLQHPGTGEKSRLSSRAFFHQSGLAVTYIRHQSGLVFYLQYTLSLCILLQFSAFATYSPLAMCCLCVWAYLTAKQRLSLCVSWRQLELFFSLFFSTYPPPVMCCLSVWAYLTAKQRLLSLCVSWR